MIRKMFKPLTLLLLIAIQCVTIFVVSENRDIVPWLMATSSIYVIWGWILRSIF